MINARETTDVWHPKKLRERRCFADNIISIVMYERDNCMTESFAQPLSRKIQSNAGMHKSRDTWRQRKHAKPHYELWHTTGTSRASWSARARARRMIKSVEWTGEKIIKFILPETEDRWSEREEGTWRLPVIFIQRLECRQNPRPLLPLPFVSLSVSLLYPLSVIRRLSFLPLIFFYLSTYLSIFRFLLLEPRVLDTHEKWIFSLGFCAAASTSTALFVNHFGPIYRN